MIGVTFALPAESSAFCRLLRKQSRDGDSIIRGDLRNQAVAILHTGVGEKICRARIEAFLARVELRCLISSGFAGGVDATLQPGDLFAAQNFSDARMLAKVSHRAGTLFTAERVIASAVERAAIAREHHAAAVDMETRFIAEACARRGLPMLSLRVISDTFARPFPAPPDVLFDLEKQRTDGAKLARHLIRHPGSIVPLIRFGRQIAHARERLATALAEFIAAE
jgi:nucleoside phosphorylase